MTRFAVILSNRGGDTFEVNEAVEFNCSIYFILFYSFIIHYLFIYYVLTYFIDKWDDKSIDDYILSYEPLVKKFLSRAPTAASTAYSYVSLVYSKNYEPAFPSSWQKMITSLDEFNLDDQLKKQSLIATNAVLQGIF